MANVLTRNIWTCASLGIISPGPVLVRAIMYYPNAVDGEFTLKWWDEDNPTVTSAKISYVVSTSTDDTITSVGNLPSTYVDGAVLKCIKTTGADSGVYGIIQTAGTDDAIVLWGSPLTADVTAYSGIFKSFPTYTAFRGKASKATDTETSMWFPFGKGGMLFPNLALDVFSASDVVIIYVG